MSARRSEGRPGATDSLVASSIAVFILASVVWALATSPEVLWALRVVKYARPE